MRCLRQYSVRVQPLTGVFYLGEAQFDASLFECFSKLLQFFQVIGFFLWRYRHVFGHLQVRHVHVVLHRWSRQTRATHSLNHTNITGKHLHIPANAKKENNYTKNCIFRDKDFLSPMFRFLLTTLIQNFRLLQTVETST